LRALANEFSLVLAALSILIAAGIGSAMRAPDAEIQSPPSVERPSITLTRPAMRGTPYRTRVAGNPLARLLRARPAARRVVRGHARLRPVRPGGPHARRLPFLVHVSATTYSTNTTWTLANSPYVIDGNVTVAAGATLTVEAGVIVKFNGTTRQLIVNGTLNASGTSGTPVFFTSLRDDSVGGDTGGDGPTSGSASQWAGIRIQNGGQATLFHVEGRYGGNGTGLLDVSGGASLTLQDSTIEHNGSYGVRLSGTTTTATATIVHSTLSDNSDGVSASGNTQVAVTARSMLVSNRHEGFNQSAKNGGGQSYILDSDIAGNAMQGLDVSVSSGGGVTAQYVPYGHRDNIYNNNGGGSQMVFSTPSIDWPDWTGNYWGAVSWQANSDARCGGQGQRVAGYLKSGSARLVDYLNNYVLSSPSALCWYTPVRIYPGDYSPTYIGSGLYTPPSQSLGLGNADGNANDLTGLLEDPVNTATGNFYHSEVDASLPGIGIPFRFQRSYNSLEGGNSVLGRGWTFSYNEALLFHSNGDVTFRAPDGAKLDFVKQSLGSYLAATGVLAQLVVVGGGYQLTGPDQRVHSFDSNGRLTALVDRNGQGLSFSYSSGLLTTITDSVGRTITLGYTSGLLTTLSLSGGRQASYGYNASGQLTSVTDLRGKLWTYTYDSQALLQKETDPRGNQAFKVLYDPTSLRASDTYDAFNNHTSFAYNASTQTATVTDPLGKVTTDVYAGNVLQSRGDPLGHTTSYAYDSAANLTSVTDPRGKTTTMTYDSRGNKLTQTAPAPLSYLQTWTYTARNDPTTYQNGRGKTTTYGYDSAGNLTSITDPLSHTTTFGYDAGGKGLLVSVTDPRSKTTAYGYDGYGNRNQIVDPLGNTTTMSCDANSGDLLTVVGPRGNVSGANPNDYKTAFSYDASGHLLTKTDPLGDVTSFTYDDNGNRITLKNALNKTWAYTLNAANELTQETAPDSSTITTTYTVRGELASITDQLGHKTSYGYDDAGRLISKVMPRGNVSGANPADYTWAYGYDAANNRTSVTDPLGHATSYAYDAINRLTSITDPLTHATAYGYDADANLSAVTDALGDQTTYTYDDADRLFSKVTPRGNVSGANPADYTWTYGYDAAGNRTSVSDPLGDQATFSYDDASHLVVSVDPRGNVAGCGCASSYSTTYGYDAAGNPTSVTDPLSHSTTFVFDRDGRLQSKTDPLSHSVSYDYDAVGRLSSVTAPDSSITSYGYDQVGNLTTRTDANLHATSYGYDAAHRLASVTNPLGKLWTFAYDADNELTSREDAIANAASNPSLGTTTYAFDRVGRKTGIDYSDSTPDVSYGYDNANRLTSTTDGAGSKSYGYDDVSRLISVTRGSSSFGYDYDAAGNLTETTYPDSTIVDYGYDDAEQLASMTQGSDTTSYAYDEAGNLLSKALPNGIEESRSYDPAGRLVELSNVDGPTHVYTDTTLTLDADGNPTQISKPGGAVENLSYDNRNRLTGVCYQSSCPGSSDPKISWTYDAVGNRQTETRPTGTLSYAYNAGDQLTSTTDGTTTTNYSYDADGRETGKGGTSLGWDLANNLISTSNGSTTTNYSYDASGNRLSASDGTNTTSYLWDENALSGLPQLARESDGGGSLIRRYLSDRSGVTTMQTGAGSFYYLRDDQGSVAQLTDGAAQSEWSYEYEPFGVAKTVTKVDPSAPDNPIQFDGQYLDSDSYNLRARQYDPRDGRFASTDPLAPAISDPYVTAYIYAEDRPTVLHDPSGMLGCGIFDHVCDAAAGTVHAVVEASSEVSYVVGEALVVGTVETLAAAIDDSSACIAGVLEGEMRGVTRDCIKAAVLAALIAAPQGRAAWEVEEALGGVYSLRNEVGTVFRTGRTNSLARRAGEHARDPELGQYRFQVEYRTDDYATQRGLEQLLHDELMPPLNKIRPVNPRNPRSDDYMRAGRVFRGGM
jgi:RHS repeat-associated protein